MVVRERADAYGEAWADVYDDEHAFMDPAGPVALLAELAGGGAVLELGIGTGRVALPLSARGVDIRGVDASEAMVGRLRTKQGGDGIAVEIADMAVPGGGPYRLVFVVFNTFFALLTQDRQIECFRNVASVLEPGGRFLLECFVPDLARFRDGNQTVRAERVDDSRLRLHVSVHDPVGQVVCTQVLLFRAGEMTMRPVALRYCWPAEIDLMARLAGLELVERWGGWNREPFTSRSMQHVSVYQRPVDARA
ncbi:MAG TPA: class I SAM-dependent methyltransferase [Acidimicrobiia bacterium]